MDVPESFPFPFQPYEIQLSFMKQLYKTLEDGKLGIFESPTGTGKSLSLCCAAIQWLKDHNENKKADIVKQLDQLKSEVNSENADEEDWLNSEYSKIKKNGEIQQLQKKLDAITIQKEKIDKMRLRKASKDTDNNTFRYKPTNQKKELPSEDSEKNPNEIKDDTSEDNEFLLDEPSDNSDSDEGEDVPQNKDSHTKIYFCSRTHSQLSQFVNEIKKTSHRSDVCVVSLASRQQYCINPSVLKLKSQHLINECCLDLQKGKKGKATQKSDDGKVTKRQKKTSGCPYFNQSNIEKLKEEILIEIKDVEDLVGNANKLKACPYYSARAAVDDSQVVVVPYQTLLHKQTRSANGINLRNSIVIIDEAHNLLETIGHIHSSEISGYQLKIALEKLKHYKNKYSSKFAAKNLLSLNQIIFIVGRILGLLKSDTLNNSSQIYTLGEFLMKAEIDNYNLRPLANFCVQSKLAQKMNGFADKYPKETDGELKVDKNQGLHSFINRLSKTPKSNEKIVVVEAQENEKRISVGNVIQSFISFLETLTSTYADGRILTFNCQNIDNAYHKFILLNPAVQFYDIVNEARAVIVAGGTMQPFSEFRDQLFVPAGASADRIVEFSCGHVIPPENILPVCLTEGPSGKRFNFTYETRKSPETLDEVGRALLNLCNVIPGGIVCFFPSYEYEKLVYNYLSSNGVVDKIQSKKKVFREPKTTTQVDSVLEEYSKVINASKKINTLNNLTGAIMLSVVGGKLSEGLNFSDDLGRCVVVIGMPYPNLKSAELQEKMKYLKENVSPNAGSIYYENLCMKAVNQCIGRAVRHAKDFATVILMDERYSRDNVRHALPKWIQDSLVTDSKFGPAFGSIRKFFVTHKSQP